MASKSDSKPAAEQPAAEQPAAEQPAAEQPAAEQPAAEQPAEQADVAAAAEEPEQPLEEACAELGIQPDADGKVELELTVSLAGANVKERGQSHVCDAAEAVRMCRAGFAKPRT